MSKCQIISLSNCRHRTTNPFNSLVLLSPPADAVMMPELKSFTANATPEIRTEVQNYQTYIKICHHGEIVMHNHTLTYVNKNNHTFCNILIHYNTKWIIPQVYLCYPHVVFIWMFLTNECFGQTLCLKFTSPDFNPLSNLGRISPYNYQYNIKETSDENKEKYQWGDHWLIQSQILLPNIIWIVLETVMRTTK